MFNLGKCGQKIEIMQHFFDNYAATKAFYAANYAAFLKTLKMGNNQYNPLLFYKNELFYHLQNL